MKLTLKAARVNAGMRQAEVAEKLHIHKTTVSNYETGKTKPDLETGLKMAEIYGVSINELSFYKSSSL